MDVGRCRVCGRPFTSGEVTGVGILRARPASEGGPFVEFACPACRAILCLVPHGHGRYAPPGHPPPPPPTDEERRVPWQRTPSTAAVPSAAAVRSSTTSSGAATNGRAARPDVDPTTAETGGAPIAGVVEDDASAISIEEALAVLGVSIGAEKATIEQAFHRLALTCHPDKVAHLDPDFAVLAARKFRRLQAARELLLNE